MRLLYITGFGAVFDIGAGAAILWLIIKMVLSEEMFVPAVMSPLSVVYAVAPGFAFTVLANRL